MTNRSLFGAVLASVALAGSALAPVHAGHAAAHAGHPHSQQFLAHHGFMKGEPKAERRARLGVAISALSQSELDAKGLEYGVRIDRVMPGSPADDAALKPGDVVTEIDGRPVYSPPRMQHLVADAADAATLVVQRGGDAVEVEARFANAEKSRAGGRAMLGIRIQAMTRELKEAFGAQGERGVLISQVKKASAANGAGLKAGDVIVAIGDQDITTVRDVHRALGAYAPGEAVDVTILRDREASTFEVALGGAAAGPQPSTRPYGRWGHDHRHHGYGHWGPGHGHRGHPGHHPGHPGHKGYRGMMPKRGCPKGPAYRHS